MQSDTDFTEFVTFSIAGQMFGLPIARVQDVFKPVRMTRVPLAGAGSPACSICADGLSPRSKCATGST